MCTTLVPKYKGSSLYGYHVPGTNTPTHIVKTPAFRLNNIQKQTMEWYMFGESLHGAQTFRGCSSTYLGTLRKKRGADAKKEKKRNVARVCSNEKSSASCFRLKMLHSSHEELREQATTLKRHHPYRGIALGANKPRGHKTHTRYVKRPGFF